MAALRILHVTSALLPQLGGPARFVRELAAEQLRRGHDVRALVAGTGGCAGGVPAASGAALAAPVDASAAALAGQAFAGTVSTGTAAPGLPVRRTSIARAGLAAWAWHFSGFRPDIVHLHYIGEAVPLLPWPAPLVLHWYRDGLEAGAAAPFARRQAVRLREGQLVRRSTRIVVPSRWYLDSSAPLHAAKGKCRVLPLGLNPDGAPLPEPLPAHPALDFLRAAPHWYGLRLLAVGRMLPYKGFATLLEAVGHMQDMRLCFVGTGPDEAMLRAYAAHFDMTDRVFFAGQVSEAVLRGCFALCDLCALPALDRREACGVTLLEAMRAGCPCLAGAVEHSGLRDLVRAGETGLFVLPGDVFSLITALHDLSYDTALRAKMGAAARARLQEHFHIRDVAAGLDGVYAETRWQARK